MLQTHPAPAHLQESRRGHRTEQQDHLLSALANHACLLFDAVDDALPVTIPYVIEGLDADERCLYVTGANPTAPVEHALQAAGIDVADEVARGALIVVPIWDDRLSAETFDPQGMIATVRESVRAALDAGFTGLRLVADMTWALQRGIGREALIAYEALGTQLLTEVPLRAVCLYDRASSSPALLRDALRTHPQLIVQDRVYANHFYEPPELVLDGDNTRRRVEWMISQVIQAQEADAALAARDAAETALRSSQELVAFVSHDLRTPLTTIKGSAQLLNRLLRRPGLPDASALERSLAQIEVASSRMEALLGELLDAARLEAGEPLTLDARPTDLVVLAEQAIADHQAWASLHHLRLVSQVPDLVGTWDAMRLLQVLMNLLSNAIKYSPDGGDVTVRLWRATEESDHWAVLAVQDSGVGIPAADLPHVFERFHRASNVTERFAGTGIGLAGVKQIVEQHNGTITVDSTEGQGTTVTVRLPLS